ncbi:cation diffusion facilitator family transporter [Lachnospiraceae bacterium KH1T2]|nr:cation diffusion facilitator family transporter [Lachnospiraceae bacterium KH1T2]
MDREKIIIRTSIIGIIANIFLAAFKAFVGMATHSIAVILDAVNNLSDALSSVITIIGTKLAGKKPDKKHPLGYGRIEYLSSMVVAAIVLYAGITSLIESVKKIIWPEAAEYSYVSIAIIAAAVLVKLILGSYVKKKGEQVKSGSLVASGSDALFDALLSMSVLASALVYMIFHMSLEAWVGVVIAIIIIRSGIGMVLESVDDMLGTRAEASISKAIKKTVAEEPEVHGAYDLFLTNYGPDKRLGALHIEVDDTMTAEEIDSLTRRITDKVYKKHGVLLTGVGIYSVNTKDNKSAIVREEVRKIVMSHEGILQFHGFYINEDEKKISFDIVYDFQVEDRKKLRDMIKKEIEAHFNGWEAQVAIDVDISD